MTAPSAAATDANSGGPAISTYAPGPAAAAARGAASATATAEPQRQQAASQSQAHTKVVYLIRHGEGWHNIGYERNVDAHLTPRGWAQTAALQQHLAALQPQLGIELVVVSPLRRTLETAAGVFGAAASPAAAAAAGAAAAAAAGGTNGPTDSSSSWVWMHPQQQKGTEVTGRAMIYLPAAAAAAACGGQGMDSSNVGGVTAGGSKGLATNQQQQQHLAPLRIVAHEGCRERIGPNVCDKYRDVILQAADFPGVDFSLLRHATDEAWHALHGAVTHDGGCYSVGEEETATEQRALEFYRWLMSRPESRIAVVSHCGFLAHGMRALGRAMLATWSNAMLQHCTGSSSSDAGVAEHAACVGVQQLSHVDGSTDMDGRAGNSKAAGSASAAPVAAAQLSEQLRVAAVEVGGRMATDWANCEMRSIQLGWVPAGAKQDGSGAAGAAGAGATGSANAAGSAAGAAGGCLWAAPGNGGEWWPGGLAGLSVEMIAGVSGVVPMAPQWW